MHSHLFWEFWYGSNRFFSFQLKDQCSEYLAFCSQIHLQSQLGLKHLNCDVSEHAHTHNFYGIQFISLALFYKIAFFLFNFGLFMSEYNYQKLLISVYARVMSQLITLIEERQQKEKRYHSLWFIMNIHVLFYFQNIQYA